MLGLSILVASIAFSSAQHGCPEPYGVQTYPDEKYCDRFFKVKRSDVIVNNCIGLAIG